MRDRATESLLSFWQRSRGFTGCAPRLAVPVIQRCLFLLLVFADIQPQCSLCIAGFSEQAGQNNSWRSRSCFLPCARSSWRTSFSPSFSFILIFICASGVLAEWPLVQYDCFQSEPVHLSTAGQFRFTGAQPIAADPSGFPDVLFSAIFRTC